MRDAKPTHSTLCQVNGSIRELHGSPVSDLMPAGCITPLLSTSMFAVRNAFLRYLTARPDFPTICAATFHDSWTI